MQGVRLCQTAPNNNNKSIKNASRPRPLYDTVSQLSTSMRRNTQLIVVAAAAPVAMVLLSRAAVNWPRCLFRFVFGVVAPTKERWFPSDDLSLSVQARGMAWILRAGPPPPHDVHPIRTMMKFFWPHVWPPNDEGSVSYCRVETIPTPRHDSQSLLVWPPNYADKQTKLEKDSDNNKLFALFHLHGGGMIAGTIGTERGLTMELARRLNVPVVSVDYRLVPEHTVQDGVDDVVAVYEWFLAT